MENLLRQFLLDELPLLSANAIQIIDFDKCGDYTLFYVCISEPLYISLCFRVWTDSQIIEVRNDDGTESECNRYSSSAKNFLYAVIVQMIQ